MMKSSEVFTPLAADYARYRPGYPPELLSMLVSVLWHAAESGRLPILAPVQGNLARLFLQAGYQVVGVEPNREMREAAECLLASYPAFRSLEGTAENIPLADQSIDLITIGQALHWFAVEQARNEFLRILRAGGWVAVAWNDRLQDTVFVQAYEALKHSYAQQHTVLCNRAICCRIG